jgi:hypothetical protein
MNYSASVLGNSYKICGINLQPLTLGHGVLLEASDLDPVKSTEQLPLALFICSRSWREAQAQMDSDWFEFRFAFFHWAVKLKLDDSKLAHWHYYVYLNSELPKAIPTAVGEKSQAEATSCTPWAQYVRMYLLAHLNYSPDTVQDASYQQGMWDMVTHLEFQGNVNLHDPDEWDNLKKELGKLNPEKEEEKGEEKGEEKEEEKGEGGDAPEEFNRMEKNGRI